MLLLASSSACDPPAPAARSTPAAPPAHATPAVVLPAAAPAPEPTPRGIRFEPAGPGDVATLVRAATARATAQGRSLLVYVGATWCEPCQHFHHAADRGELDGEFPDLTLLEFDLDRDAERLAAAGYVSRMIPLFTVPAADGRATERHIEGSIHGVAAVREIAPRLAALRAPP